MNIKKSKFYSGGGVEDILNASWVANNELQDIPTNKWITNRQINKVKNLNSNSLGFYNSIQVTSIDDVNDYTFDSSVFKVLNQYLTNTKVNKRTRFCGYIRLYAIGFFEEWMSQIEKAPDLIEQGPNIDKSTAHNIYDDLEASINEYNDKIEKDLAKIIKSHEMLQSRELEILKIRTVHQLTYFMNRINSIINDPDELGKIMEEVGSLRNKYVVDKESKLAEEFIAKYPNYVTLQYYRSHGSEFSNDIFRILPNSTAIAVNKNAYGSCELTLD